MKRPALRRGSRREKSVVGLDIGSHLVKLVAISGTNGTRRLEVAATAPLPADAVNDGEIVDPAAVVETIRQLVEENPLPTRRVAIAVSGRAIIVKNIWMDRVSDADMPQAIQWEAEQHIPFDLNEVYLDHQVLRADETGKRVQVLIVAAKREGIENLASMVGEAGLYPVIVDVDSFAAQNAILASYPVATDRVEAIVDIGAEYTNIIVLSDSVPILTSNAAFGTARLVDAALKRFPASREEIAVALAAPDASTDLTDTVAQAAEDLSVAVDRSLSYLDVRQVGETSGLWRLIVCGGGACVPSLVEFLHARHKLEVEVANPLAGIDVSSLGSPEDARRMAPLLTVGVGLALRRAED